MRARKVEEKLCTHLIEVLWQMIGHQVRSCHGNLRRLHQYSVAGGDGPNEWQQDELHWVVPCAKYGHHPQGVRLGIGRTELESAGKVLVHRRALRPLVEVSDGSQDVCSDHSTFNYEALHLALHKKMSHVVREEENESSWQLDSLDGDVVQVTYCYSLNVGTPEADLSKQLIASLSASVYF